MGITVRLNSRGVPRFFQTSDALRECNRGTYDHLHQSGNNENVFGLHCERYDF